MTPVNAVFFRRNSDSAQQEMPQSIYFTILALKLFESDCMHPIKEVNYFWIELTQSKAPQGTFPPGFGVFLMVG